MIFALEEREPSVGTAGQRHPAEHQAGTQLSCISDADGLAYTDGGWYTLRQFFPVLSVKLQRQKGGTLNPHDAHVMPT